MKKLLRNISFIAVLLAGLSACTEADPEYTDFPSKDVDFSYSVAPNPDGEVEYALDYYVVSTIQFTNTSAKEGSVTWDFGDGTSSTEENPQHKYAEAGYYNVKLTVEGVGSRTYPLMINDIAPVLSVKEQLTTAGGSRRHNHYQRCDRGFRHFPSKPGKQACPLRLDFPGRYYDRGRAGNLHVYRLC